jgi:hypothetical protein
MIRLAVEETMTFGELGELVCDIIPQCMSCPKLDANVVFVIAVAATSEYHRPQDYYVVECTEWRRRQSVG